MADGFGFVHSSFACFHAPETSFAWRFPNSVIIIWAIGLLAGTFVSKSAEPLLEGSAS